MQNSGAIAPDTASDLALFLQSLAEQGQARVSSEPLGPEVGEALAVLRQLDQLSRDELALDAPEYLPDTALWAARLFYHLCQFTVCRLSLIHISEPTRLLSISYAVFCLKKK